MYGGRGRGGCGQDAVETVDGGMSPALSICMYERVGMLIL